MNDLWPIVLLAVATLAVLVIAGGRSREDARVRRRWDAVFDHESRKIVRTDATGMLVCRSCGASASERAGRCPRCGSVL